MLGLQLGRIPALLALAVPGLELIDVDLLGIEDLAQTTELGRVELDGVLKQA